MMWRSSRSAWMPALGLAALAAAGLSAWAQANSPPNPVFKTSPPADTNGRITGPIPLEVTFNMCQSTDPDLGDELRFTYDFDGDGKVDFRGPCRASEVYRRDRCTPVTVCVSDRNITLDGHTICRKYEVCPFGRDEGPGAAGPQVLFASNGAAGNLGNLLTLNPTNGAIASTIGPIGFAVTGLAQHPTTKVLYGVTGDVTVVPPSLIQINTTTGAGTLIGMIDAAVEPITDITFSPSGTLFGWGEDEDDLYTINPATGATTLVGDSGLGSTFGGGLALSPGGTMFLSKDDSCDELRTVDLANGLTTVVATLNGSPDPCSNVSALAFDAAGTLFGVVGLGSEGGDTFLVTINTATGVITNRGQIPGGDIDAIAWSVP